MTSPPPNQDGPDASRPLVHQVSNDSKASVTESMSEFFDAHEYFLSSSSSENEVRGHPLFILVFSFMLRAFVVIYFFQLLDGSSSGGKSGCLATGRLLVRSPGSSPS